MSNQLAQTEGRAATLYRAEVRDHSSQGLGRPNESSQTPAETPFSNVRSSGTQIDTDEVKGQEAQSAWRPAAATGDADSGVGAKRKRVSYAQEQNMQAVIDLIEDMMGQFSKEAGEIAATQLKQADKRAAKQQMQADERAYRFMKFQVQMQTNQMRFQMRLLATLMNPSGPSPAGPTCHPDQHAGFMPSGSSMPDTSDWQLEQQDSAEASADARFRRFLRQVQHDQMQLQAQLLADFKQFLRPGPAGPAHHSGLHVGSMPPGLPLPDDNASPGPTLLDNNAMADPPMPDTIADRQLEQQDSAQASAKSKFRRFQQQVQHDQTQLRAQLLAELTQSSHPGSSMPDNNADAGSSMPDDN